MSENATKLPTWSVTCDCGYQRTGLPSRRAAEDDEGDHIGCMTRGCSEQEEPQHHTKIHWG